MSLVALCFVAVLGISLAGYIAVCSRAMNLSNRAFQGGVSKQLAEAGLEEALRAFNQNDWSDWSNNGYAANWTLDTSNKRATATMTVPAGKLGQGTTATVKIRVDNYDAMVARSTWNSSTNYRVNDLVGRSGIWYRCIKNHSNQQPPNWNYWVPEGIPWQWDAGKTYSVEDLIVYNEVWYRCTSGNTNKPPPTNAAAWQALAAIYTSTPSWPYVASGQEALLFSGGAIVRLTYQNWGTNPPYAWRWRSGALYDFNDSVYYNGVWYRANTKHTSDWNNYPQGWQSAWTRITSVWAWSASINYSLGDVVYHSGTSDWYRCIKANSNQTPSGSSSYWANTPSYSTIWDSGKQYSQYDTVYHHGAWYLSLQDTNVDQNPSTATTYWIGTNTTDTSYTWNSTSNYTAGAYRCYGGVWYRCTTNHTNKSPNDTDYWTATWANSFGVSTGATVAYAEATVTIAGSPAQQTRLRATLAPAPLFPNAAGASTDLTITTGPGTVDSYDSSVAAYNAGTAGHSAVLAAGSTLSILGTTAVKGYLAAPSLPANISTATTVKGPASPASNLDPTRLSRSPYIPQFDIFDLGGRGTPLPDVSSWPAAGLGIGTPGATAPGYYNVTGDLVVGSGDTLTVNGPVYLDVSGYLIIENGGKITVASTGSLVVRMSKLDVKSTGAGFINQTQDPQKLIVLPVGNHGSHNYLAAGDFFGCISLTLANVSANRLMIGSGIQYHGAISAKNITFSSEANLHYDTSLRYATIPGVDQPYAVAEWRELPLTEQATMP